MNLWRPKPWLLPTVLVCMGFSCAALADLDQWSRVGLGSFSVADVVIDPNDSNVVYAAADGGVFASVDRGITWAGTGLAFVGTRALVIDPADSAVLYAGTADGVLKSTDRGLNWSATGLDQAVNALAHDPIKSDVIYAGIGAGVFKSSDGGTSWVASNQGLSNPLVLTIGIDPGNPDVLYAGTVDGLFASTDAGASWTDASAGLPDRVVRDLLVVAGASGLIYAAANGTSAGGVFESRDGASTWIATGLVNEPSRALALDPFNSSVLYAATDRGDVFRSVDAAVTWAAFDEGLFAPQTSSLTVDPIDATILYAGTNAGVFQRGQTTPPRPAADLAASLVDDVDPVFQGNFVVYTITVTNNGPDAANGVVVQNAMTTASGTLIGISDSEPSQGRCVSAGIFCDLGELGAGVSATVDLLVGVDTFEPAVRLSTSVASITDDVMPANNTGVEETAVELLIFTPAPNPDGGGFGVGPWSVLVLLLWGLRRVVRTRDGAPPSEHVGD